MAYLKNAYFSDYSVNALKSLLTANKAVAVMYNAQNAYYNANTAAYSYPEETDDVNHVVTVVGWDDNYSAKNFNASSNVKNNGAWIVKTAGERTGEKTDIFICPMKMVLSVNWFLLLRHGIRNTPITIFMTDPPVLQV